MKHLTLTATFYAEINPGNEAHLKQVLKNYLEGKGIATEQKWIDGKPYHDVIIN